MAGIHPVDYVVFAILISASIGTGLYYAVKGNKTTADYLIGNRKLKLFPVAMSFTASLYSAILIIGHPAETYTTGGGNIFFIAGCLFAAIGACTLFIPVIYPLKLTSINTYLAMRYHSTAVALVGTISNLITMVPVTAIVCIGPALTINAFTGFPVWASILLGNFITITYTTIGGIKAVIWADVCQLLLMIAGILAICIQAIREVGGFGEVIDICKQNERLDILNFNPDPRVRLTVWTCCIGLGFSELFRYGISQVSVQRYSSLPSISQAYLCVLSAIPITLLLFSLSTVCGLAMFAYYESIACDPVRGGIIENQNQLIPYFAITVLNVPGVPGMLLAGITAASLSSASSLINACAANFWKDILLLIWPNLSETRGVLVTKLMVLLIGVFVTACCFIIMEIGGSLLSMVITFVSAASGPTGAMFIMGIFFPFGNRTGALTGVFTGFAFAMWMGFGAVTTKIQSESLPTTITNCSDYFSESLAGMLPYNGTNTSSMAPSTVSILTLDTVTELSSESSPLDNLYAISYLWIALFSATLALVVGIITSLLTGGAKGLVCEARLFHPLVRKFLQTPPKQTDPSSEELLKGKSNEERIALQKA